MSTDLAENEGNVTTLVPKGSEERALPSTGLLSFYDRLRERIARFLADRGGSAGERASDALLLVPDVFMLLVRLSLDREVPSQTRALIGGALVYFLLPADFIPELAVGPLGYLDDLVLSLMVLSHSFSKDLEPLAERHWSGSRKLRRVLQDGLESASSLVGDNIYERLQSLLAKRGIEWDESASAEKDSGVNY